MKNKKDKIQKGAASIKLELLNGTLTVYHGTDKKTLLVITNVQNGAWDSIWNVINSIKSIHKG